MTIIGCLSAVDTQYKHLYTSIFGVLFFIVRRIALRFYLVEWVNVHVCL